MQQSDRQTVGLVCIAVFSLLAMGLIIVKQLSRKSTENTLAKIPQLAAPTPTQTSVSEEHALTKIPSPTPEPTTSINPREQLPSPPPSRENSFSQLLDAHCYQTSMQKLIDFGTPKMVDLQVERIPLSLLPFTISPEVRQIWSIADEVTCEGYNDWEGCSLLNNPSACRRYKRYIHIGEGTFLGGTAIYFVHENSQREGELSNGIDYAFDFPQSATCIEGKMHGFNSSNPGAKGYGETYWNCLKISPTKEDAGEEIDLVIVPGGGPCDYYRDGVNVYLLGNKTSPDGVIGAKVFVAEKISMSAHPEVARVFDENTTQLGPCWEPSLDGYQELDKQLNQQLDSDQLSHDEYVQKRNRLLGDIEKKLDVLLLEEFAKTAQYAQMKQKLELTLAGIEWK